VVQAGGNADNDATLAILAASSFSGEITVYNESE